MGVSICPVVENYDTDEFLLQVNGEYVEWKWLSDCLCSARMEVLCQQLNLTPLGEFLTYSREHALDEMGEEDVEEMEAEAELRDGTYFLDGGVLWSVETQWFEPAAALLTTQGILEYASSHPEYFGDGEALNDDKLDTRGVVYILQELNSVLVRAQDEGKRFHLVCLA